MKKILVLSALLCIFVYATPDISIKKVQEEVVTPQTKISLSLEELQAFNGKNGSKAYVAIDEIIYEVTDVKAWKNGKHKGNQAGADLSQPITKAPHGKKVLENLKKIGVLKEKVITTDKK